MDLAITVTAFALIFPIELPDKTFVATLVLATRYRALPVWIGVTSAFLIQTIVACTLGGLIGRLPRTPVEVFAALMFLVGAIILLRGASSADAGEEEAEREFAGRGREGATGLRAAGTSFLVLFAAEWGDLSQLLTAGLVVRNPDDAVSVGVGAFSALALVSALGAVLGRQLLKRVRLATITRVGAAVCLLLALVSLLQVFGITLPI